MKKFELVLQELKSLGFGMNELEQGWYHFAYEDSQLLYMPAEDDDDFLRFAVPEILDITDENRSMVLEIVNKTNVDLKYVKAVILNESLWIFIEYRMCGEQPMGDLLEYVIRLLQFSKEYVQSILNGDFIDEEDEKNEDSKED